MLSIIEKCHHKDEIESVFAYSDLLSQVLSETLSHIVVVIVFDRVTIHNTNMDTHTYSHSLMAVLRPCVSTTSCWRLLATRSCAPPNAMLCYVLLCYARCSPLCMQHSTDIFPGMAWRAWDIVGWDERTSHRVVKCFSVAVTLTAGCCYPKNSSRNLRKKSNNSFMVYHCSCGFKICISRA